jgi:hypothetical protein
VIELEVGEEGEEGEEVKVGEDWRETSLRIWMR